MDNNSEIAYMMGAKLVKNECPNYMCWKFPDEDQCKKMNLLDFSDDFKKLNTPTWKSLKFEEDWNRMLLILKVAKRRLNYIENKLKSDQKIQLFQSVEELKKQLDITIEHLKTLDRNDTYDSIVIFSKLFNDKFRWI